jgi:ABC-type thiamin/hydroxymethylpyrimidine transport system permease subunit
MGPASPVSREENRMAGVGWKLRVSVFLQRLWQPTFACMTCMTAPSFANLLSAAHWKLALQTGVGTGILALLLTFTPVGRLFTHRYGNALLVGVLTAIADAWSHPGRFGIEYGEALLTGLVSGLLALAGWFLLEDRARRVRHAWARIRGIGVSR